MEVPERLPSMCHMMNFFLPQHSEERGRRRREEERRLRDLMAMNSYIQLGSTVKETILK